MTNLFAVFIILHGLVHLWYVTLSLRLVAHMPEMGWSGESWLLTRVLGDAATRAISTLLYGLACLGFVAAGAGLLLGQPWFRPMMLRSAVVSLVAIGGFWDGKTSQIVEKGIIGFTISLLVVIALVVFGWPPGIA